MGLAREKRMESIFDKGVRREDSYLLKLVVDPRIHCLVGFCRVDIIIGTCRFVTAESALLLMEAEYVAH